MDNSFNFKDSDDLKLTICASTLPVYPLLDFLMY